MDKKIAEIIRERRTKEREETKWSRAVDSHTITNKVVERLVEKWYKVNFNWAWFIMEIEEAGDKFH